MMRLAWFVGSLEEQGRGRGRLILPVSGVQHIFGLTGGSAGFPKEAAFRCLQEVGRFFGKRSSYSWKWWGCVHPLLAVLLSPVVLRPGTGVCRCTPRFLLW